MQAGGEPKRILIFRPGSIGDAVVSIPAINKIKDKYPEAELALCTSVNKFAETSSAGELLKALGFVTEVLYYQVGEGAFSKQLELRKQILKAKYDLFVYLG